MSLDRPKASTQATTRGEYLHCLPTTLGWYFSFLLNASVVLEAFYRLTMDPFPQQNGLTPSGDCPHSSTGGLGGSSMYQKGCPSFSSLGVRLGLSPAGLDRISSDARNSFKKRKHAWEVPIPASLRKSNSLGLNPETFWSSRGLSLFIIRTEMTVIISAKSSIHFDNCWVTSKLLIMGSNRKL